VATLHPESEEQDYTKGNLTEPAQHNQTKQNKSSINVVELISTKKNKGVQLQQIRN